MQHKKYNQVVLIVLDGFGVASPSRGNAITTANIQTFNNLVENFPSLTLQASGPLVGLPWGEMGNSEVGHLNIGAGRIVGQDLPRITLEIQSRKFFKNPAFLKAIEHVEKNNSTLHLMGMVSPGGVHSSDEHLYALLGLAAERHLKRVFVHMFTDGRDTEPKVALESVKKLKSKMFVSMVGEIATVSGRFYAMDRGGHWNQTILTYNALVKGQGPTAKSPEEAVQANYDKEIFDETIPPTVILDLNGQPVAKISDNDAVIYFNFRQDRALQLTQAFVAPENLPEELRQPPLQNLLFVTMTEYGSHLPVEIAYASPKLDNNLAEVISKNGMSQFHIAESEKYAHVSGFFNCGHNDKYPGEERNIVTSPDNTRNYSNHPEMSAEELTKSLVEKINTDVSFIIANYANPDIVGHTGNFVATVQAISYLDSCIAKVADACLKKDAALLITADHGNAEQMINNKTGDIDKDHTTNPVPLLFIINELKFPTPLHLTFGSLAARTPEGVISDIAPTILELFGLPKPAEMTGINLVELLDNEKIVE